MYAGFCPFRIASIKDELYKHIARGDYSKFWRFHERFVPQGYFTEEFKDLITNMLSFQPFARLQIADIVAHPFFSNDL